MKSGRFFVGVLAGVLLCCAGTLGAQQSLTLDEVVALAGRDIEGKIKSGANLAVLNFDSGSEMFSEYVVEELTGALVMGGKVSVVERRSLDLLREEAHLQLSGDVGDDVAVSIGKQLGAQGIVTGSLQDMGDAFRFRIKVINVESARIEAQFGYNLRKDGRTAFFMSGDTGGQPAGGTAPASGAAQGAGAAQAPKTGGATSAGGAAQPKTGGGAAPAGGASGGMTQAGLYAGAAFQGAMFLYEAVEWLKKNVQTGGNYTIVLNRDQEIAPAEFSYPDKKMVDITLKTAGRKHTVAFDDPRSQSSLFTVGQGVTFTLEEGVTLQGTQNNVAKSLVRVNGGKFVMNGGVLTGNKTNGSGGGVQVNSGTFTMNNGTISGNTATSYGSGGGVSVASGTFTMNNGTISGNSSSSYGGGVYVSGTFTMSGGTISGNSAGKGGGLRVSGTFTMSGGTISGNTSNNEGGGGVYVEYSSTFTKSGGVIYGSNEPDESLANKAKDDSRGHAVYSGSGKKRNTTARATTAMDSRRDGPSGGWE
jgi:TolB-like protein